MKAKLNFKENTCAESPGSFNSDGKVTLNISGLTRDEYRHLIYNILQGLPKRVG